MERGGGGKEKSGVGVEWWSGVVEWSGGVAEWSGGGKYAAYDSPVNHHLHKSCLSRDKVSMVYPFKRAYIYTLLKKVGIVYPF